MSKDKTEVSPRKPTELETVAYCADDAWGNGCGVEDWVTDLLDKSGLTVTMPATEYYESEIEDDPDFNSEFDSVSVWTDDGLKFLSTLQSEISAGLVIAPDPDTIH